MTPEHLFNCMMKKIPVGVISQGKIYFVRSVGERSSFLDCDTTREEFLEYMNTGIFEMDEELESTIRSKDLIKATNQYFDGLNEFLKDK